MSSAEIPGFGRGRPLGERVLVRKDPFQKKSKGGVLLPDIAQTRPETGTVLAVGSGKRLDDGTVVPLSVQAGDRVLFTSFAGSETGRRSDDDEAVVAMREDDILAVLGE